MFSELVVTSGVVVDVVVVVEIVVVDVVVVGVVDITGTHTVSYIKLLIQ